jgi:hypothetical protein
MSGAAGHLMHLYDDPEITFREIKDVLTRAAQGKLEQVTEKLDGRNIVFTWNVKEGGLKVARAAGDIARGGMNAQELAQKFEGRESLEEAFNSAFEVLTSAISILGRKLQTDVFGPSGNRWYSAEIIYAASPNVVSYDSNSVVFHGSPIFNVSNTGEVEQTNDSTGIDILTTNIERMQSGLKRKDWSVHGPAIVAMQAMSDKTILSDVISEIDAAISNAGVSDDDTIQDYIESKVMSTLSKDLSGSLLNSVAARVLKKPGAPNLTQLKKMAPLSKELVDRIVKNGEKTVRDTLIPLDKAIGKFAIKVLESLKSSFISDNEREVMRLRKATDDAIRTIQGSGDAGAISFLEKQLNRLGSAENIKSAVEGIVFKYNDKTYKFTGAFAAANQILGFYRYRQPAKAPVSESTLRSVIRLMLF